MKETKGTFFKVSFFYPQTAQNHQQPGQSIPVEVISHHQQGCQFGAAPTIGEATIADAIMDRLIHRSHKLELHGESMRKHANKIPEAANE